MKWTAREQELMDCLLKGLKTDEICGELGITEIAVKRRVRRMADKLEIDSRVFHLRPRLVYLHYFGGTR